MNKKIIAGFLAMAVVFGASSSLGIPSVVSETASITAYAAEAESALDPANLEDGIYKLNVDMVKTDRTSSSMSDGAINHEVQLEVIDGKYYITVQFKSLTITGLEGYLSNLYYYDAGYTYNEYGYPQGTVKQAEVLSYYYGVVDTFNNEDDPYPYTMRFPLVDGGGIEYIPLQVFVPIMEALSAGSGTQDVFMKPDWNSLQVKETKLTGSSLSVSGNITLNNYIELSDTVLGDSNAKVVSTVNGFTTETAVSSAENTENGYLFKLNVPAKDMTSDVTVDVVLGDGTVADTYTVSVEKYAANLIYGDSTASEDQIAAAKALLNYGAYAQLYFGTNTDNLANAKLSNDEKSLDSVTDASFDEFEGYTQSDNATDVGIRYMGSGLSLVSETAIKHYFKVVDVDSLTFTVNGKTVTPIYDAAKQQYYVPVVGISAPNLGTKYTVTVSNGSDTYTLDYSAMDYCKLAQTSTDSTDELKNVTKALYLLYNAAK